MCNKKQKLNISTKSDRAFEIIGSCLSVVLSFALAIDIVKNMQVNNNAINIIFLFLKIFTSPFFHI